MKTCSRCKAEKPLDEFNKNRRNPDGLQGQCRVCSRAAQAKNYRESEKTRASIRANNRKNVAENSIYLYNYLLEHPCVQCGEGDPVVLEFDHLDRATKVNNVSQLVRFGRKMMLAEIEKCEVLCCNCHRRRTARQMGWYQYDGHPLKGKL